MTEGSAAWQCVAVHMRLLQRVGFMRAPGGTGRGGYRALVLAVTAAYLLQECVYAYQERSDMSKLSQVMFLLLCHITSIVKQIVFHIDADRIDQLIESLNGQYNVIIKITKRKLIFCYTEIFCRAYLQQRVSTCARASVSHDGERASVAACVRRVRCADVHAVGHVRGVATRVWTRR